MKHVSKFIIPQPSTSSLQKRFSFISLCPGIIQPTVKYFIKIMDKMTPEEKIIGGCFDEINTQNRADLDSRFDAIVGPAKNAQNFMVRSLCSEKIRKFPVWLDFDTMVNNSEYNRVIYTLESIGLRYCVSTCDMGTLNVSLGMISNKMSILIKYFKDYTI